MLHWRPGHDFACATGVSACVYYSKCKDPSKVVKGLRMGIDEVMALVNDCKLLTKVYDKDRVHSVRTRSSTPRGDALGPGGVAECSGTAGRGRAAAPCASAARRDDTQLRQTAARGRRGRGFTG